MKNENTINVMLRPATGFQYGKMLCEFYDDYFELTVKREALIQLSTGQKYKIPYKAIESLTENNYLYVPGIKIELNDPNIDFPASPSKVMDGLIGGLISLFRRKLFILYFSNKKDYNFFIQQFENYKKHNL